MGDCPFCGASVSDDLILYGGTCPSCFGEIPGEEAATDPGEEVKAEIEAQDNRRAFWKAMVPVAMAVPVLMVLAGVALWFAVLRPEPQVAVLDFDDMDEYYVPEFVGVAGDGEEDPEDPEDPGSANPATAPRPAAAPRPTTASGNPLLSGSGADSVAGTEPGEIALADPTAGGDGGLKGPRGSVGGAQTPEGLTPDNLGGTTSGGDNPLSLGQLGTAVSRRKPLLESPEQIRDHIFSVMKAGLPRLQGCYDRALKTEPDLAGKWRLSFVVTKEGTVKEASATGINVKAPELEECFSKQISKWSFYRLKSDQPVQKSVTFRPKGF